MSKNITPTAITIAVITIFDDSSTLIFENPKQ